MKTDQTLLREIKDLNKQKTFHFHRLKHLILLKMAILPQAIYRFSVFLAKYQWPFFFSFFAKM